MAENQKDPYIRYLVEMVNELDLDKRVMEFAVNEFQAIHNNVLEQLFELQKSVAGISLSYAMSATGARRPRRKQRNSTSS